MNILALVATVATVFGASTPGVSTSTPTNSPWTPCVTISGPLAFGSTGPDVVALQKFLGVIQTGYFGPLTKQKVIEWQVSYKIVPTATSDGAGMVGPKTRTALHCTTTVAYPAASGTSTTNTNVEPPASPAPSTPTGPASGGASGSSGGSNSGGGSSGGGTYMGPAGYVCQNLPAKPSADTCTTGSWQTIQDDAGCYIWNCSDPSNTQG